MEFSVHCFTESEELGKALVKCLNHPEASEFSQIGFKNKYFQASVQVFFHDFLPISLNPPYAVILLKTPSLSQFFSNNREVFEESECNILLSDIKHNEFQSCCEELNIEFIWEKIEDFKGFAKVDGEMQGIGRIKEALECAVAGFIKRPQEKAGNKENDEKVEEIKEKHKKEEEIQEDESKLEDDMENFEYFLSKIRENCEAAKSLDDETRRKNAEDTIRQLAEYLKLEDDDIT